MLTVRLPKELEDRLEKLAKKTERSKGYYVRKALEGFLDDREDYLLGLAALEEDDGTRYSLEEVMRIAGIEKDNDDR